MKKFLLLLFLLTCAFSAFAQGPAWQQAVVVSQPIGAVSSVMRTAVDASGNVYLTGTFTGPVTFGATTLTAPMGVNPLFLAKWSSTTGQFAWAVQQNDGAFTYPVDISLQGISIYVGATSTTTQVAHIYKFTDADTRANLAWNQVLSDCNLTGLTASGNNVYVSGNFSTATLAVGSFTLTNNSPRSLDVFVAKLVDAGTSSSYTWALRAGGSTTESGGPMAIQGSSLYLMGTFQGTTTAPSVFGTTSLVSADDADVYVAKLTDAGPSAQFTWVKRMGGLGSDQAGALAVAGTAVYATGSFSSSSADFGSSTLTSAGNTDVFVVKLTDAGATADFTWAQRAGGTGNESAAALAVQGTSIYVAGSADSPSLAFGATTVSNAGLQDGFLVALTDANSTSSFAWARAISTSGSDRVNALSISGSTVYIGGYAGEGSVKLGSVTLTNAAGNNAAYFASFTPTVLSTTTPVLTGSSLYPNPASARTSVRLPALPAASAATLTLYDGLGRIVTTLTVAVPASGLTQEIDLRGLQRGGYQLHVQAGTVFVSQRLVVE